MEQYRRNRWTIAGYSLPGLLIYTLFAVAPIAYAVILAFYDWKGLAGTPVTFVGVGNFVRVLNSPQFYTAFGNMFIHIVLNVAVQLPLGYFLAILLSGQLRGFKVFKAGYFIPAIIPITASGVLWANFIYYPNAEGVLNTFLRYLGLGSLQTAWLIDPATATPAIAAVSIWMGFGYHMIIGFAAVQGIDGEIIDAALIDGVNAWQKIRLVILPMIRNAVAISVVLCTTGMVKLFDQVYVMTGGGPNGMTHVPATLLYYEAFKYNRYGVGSAISVAILFFSIAISAVNIRLMNGKDD